MKLKFNPGLDYQQDAIESTLAIFEGLSTQGDGYTQLGIANSLELNPDKLLANIQQIQTRNFIEKSTDLFCFVDLYLFPNFSIEMETGTGKTYVYLRSIFELHKQKACANLLLWCPV